MDQCDAIFVMEQVLIFHLNLVKHIMQNVSTIKDVNYFKQNGLVVPNANVAV